MATRRWRGAGDEGAAGSRRPRSPPDVDPAHTGDGLGDGARAFALARTAGRTQLEATVVRRANRHLSVAAASRKSEAAAALVRDRRRSPASCVTSPERHPG